MDDDRAIGPGAIGPGAIGPGPLGPGPDTAVVPAPTGDPALDPSAPHLVLADLTVGYRGHGWRRPDRVVLAGLSLRAAAGRLTMLLGPNGTGKSTLLRSIAGLQRPLGGSASLGGTDLAGLAPRQRATRVAVVLTERFDPGLLRGADVVALGRFPHQRATGTLSHDDRDVIAGALAAVHARELADTMLARMSDGQRQRIMIARALAQQPELLLLDEPSAFLDAPARIELLHVLRAIAVRRGIPVVASSHDVELAVRLGEDAWLIGPGGVVTRGVVAELSRSGAIGAAFDTDTVAFDPATGTFLLRE